MEREQTPVWSITELNEVLRDLLENSLLPVKVRGEVSGLTLHRSGHVYLTLKDEHAQIRATFFNGVRACRELGIENGTQVEAEGKVSYYTARGDCQLSVRSLYPLGAGLLQIRFEELRKRLASEGLFDPAKKRRLPFIPRRIGIVTSPSGAALKDFIKVALQRFPPLSFRLFPAPVQGKGAEKILAQGVEYLNRYGRVDVILVTRGGGAIEDLWPFNEEVLARAVASSKVPVVSAVGHEIDTTICDLAADFRAPTPTAAAEAILPDLNALFDKIGQARRRLKGSCELSYERARRRLEGLLSAKALTRPSQLILEKTQTIDLLVRDMETAWERAVENAERRLQNAQIRLKTMNPLYILDKGYAILLDSSEKAIKFPEDAPNGTKLTAIIAGGRLGVVSQGGILPQKRNREI